jgi:hypothetical protein
MARVTCALTQFTATARVRRPKPNAVAPTNDDDGQFPRSEGNQAQSPWLRSTGDRLRAKPNR